MESCIICKREFKSLASLGKHIKGTHNIISEDYYVNYLNNERGKCRCGNPTKYRNLNIGYLNSCSYKCSYHNSEVTKKRESTNLERFGSVNVNSSDVVKQKRKDTMLTRYGVNHPSHMDDFSKKTEKTTMERYGVKNVSQVPEFQDKRKNTCLEKYGTEHPMQNKVIHGKAKKTSLNKFGVEFPIQNQEVRKTYIKTCLEKYGETSPSKHSDIKLKTRNTNKERYGVEYPIQNKEIFEKARVTTRERYGVDYASQHTQFNHKRIETCLIKYGTEYASQNELVKKNIVKSCVKRFGVENPMKFKDIHDKAVNTNIDRHGIAYAFTSDDARKTKKSNSLLRMQDKYKSSLDLYKCELNEYTSEGNFIYKCLECNTTSVESWQFVVVCRFNHKQTPCTNCMPKEIKTSFMEIELSNFVKTCDSNVLTSDRTVLYPNELDIYSPDKKLAFELNGLYWHNELYKSPNYHLTKTESCEDKGIQLIHVFEDDWIYKNNIVKSRIKTLFGQSERIYGRKCVIDIVTNKESNEFLDNNHIQGKCPSKHRYGLYHKGELVSLMTFGKSRYDKGKVELLRFCNKLNISVVGGASKLFKHFLKSSIEIDEIISYADRCWSMGNLYEQLGFKFVHNTSPNYKYVNGNIRESRVKYQKHKLVADGFDSTKTEREIMFDRKLYRIYDSGNLKYSYIKGQ